MSLTLSAKLEALTSGSVVAHTIVTDELQAPSHWIDGKRAWRQIVIKARQYAKCRPKWIDDSVDELAIENLFDDLANTAAAIRQGTTIEELRRWLCDPAVRSMETARQLRNLVAIMDKLEIF